METGHGIAVYFDGYDLPTVQMFESHSYVFGYANSDLFAQYDLQECGVFRALV
jgi:hypothetical protein